MSGFQPPSNVQYQNYSDPSNPYGPQDGQHQQQGGQAYGSQEGYDSESDLLRREGREGTRDGHAAVAPLPSPLSLGPPSSSRADRLPSSLITIAS